MEYPFHQPSPFEELLREKAAQGWEFLGREELTQVKFMPDARFVPIQIQTEDDIRTRYGVDGKEVELVVQYSEKIKDLKKILTEEEMAKVVIGDQDKSYLVFVRDMQNP